MRPFAGAIKEIIMITDVQLPTPDALQPLIDEALEGGALTKSDFVTNHCVGIITAW